MGRSASAGTMDRGGSTRAERWRTTPRRLEAIVLVGAMVCSAGLMLWLNRGGTYFADDLAWFAFSPDLSAGELLEPHYGHLIALPRLLYKTVLETLGSDYLTFRILLAIVVASGAGLFFVYARRRVGGPVALVPAVLLLFLGADWYHLVIPNGITVIGSVALGLAALIALDRRDRRGDLLACLCLSLGIATYSAALPFVVATAVSVLFGADRKSRIWIFAVPAGLYAAWLLLARETGVSSPSEQTDLVNILAAPTWAFDSLALALSVLTGVAYDFDFFYPTVDLAIGQLLAVAAVGAFLWQLRRRGASPWLWVALAVPLTYWTMGALAGGIEDRVPENPRYIYPGVVGVLLVAIELFRGVRPSSPVRWVVLGIGVLALSMNLALLRDGAKLYRETWTPRTRALLTSLELSRSRVDPAFDPAEAGISSLGSVWDALERTGEPPTAAYLRASWRYGSPAFSIEELASQDDEVLTKVDATLVSALDLRLEPGHRPPGQGCRTLTGSTAGPPSGPLPGGGASMATEPAGAAVSVRRFANEAWVPIGTLGSEGWTELRLPPTGGAPRWQISADAQALTLCPRP